MRGKKRPREKPPPSYKNQVSFQLKRERKRGRMKEKEQKKRKKSNPNYRIALELWEIHTKFSLFTDLNSSLLKFLSVASLGSKCQDDKCTGACFHTQISQADLVVLDPVRDPWFHCGFLAGWREACMWLTTDPGASSDVFWALLHLGGFCD